ncbi:T9SS type A sorting domain-containing protein [Spirosoma fluviale]|uniref:Por secretion system C-terminal sorting domain-containing protein n=1 Tax=Spirosoma fluviale TaxID=1597977 RepID=A0A286GJA7_9BACT|nr:T9SS type A sorting domain-containing protein [Spirosoma fluviale]SOD95064.1 Por secretion system C-terminal sorting domain-containing protein [Spirosoma fluviale]
MRVLVSYDKGGQHLEQAVETIVAANTVGKTSTVAYQAGRSITLLPGFQASQGSLFTADIKPVTSGGNELSLQLKAYPNPFDESTMIDYYLPADGKVTIVITDAQGKVISQLMKDENQAAGKHQIEWNSTALKAGMYIPVIEHNQKKAVGRLVKK